MRSPSRVVVLGGGRLAFGALSMVRAAIASGAPFSLGGWARAESGRAVLQDAGAHVVDSADEAVRGAAVVILAVPAPSLKDVVIAAAPGASGDQIVLHAARGTCHGFALPHEVVGRHSCWKKVTALGGPLYLDDAKTGRALNAAVASRFDEAIAMTRALVKGAPIRLSATHDIVGVELCGALSNVGHLAAGLAHGAGLSETDQGLLHVRALLEAGRLGRAMGAERATFSGLAGVGDLIPRRVSSQRKHKELGQRLAVGDDVGDAVTMLEGAVTAREGAPFAARHHVDAPLLNAIASLLADWSERKDRLDTARVAATLSGVLDLELGLQAS